MLEYFKCRLSLLTDEQNEAAASSSAGQNNDELPSNATTIVDSTTKLVSHATRHQDHMAVDESDEEEEEFISGEKNIVYITFFDTFLFLYCMTVYYKTKTIPNLNGYYNIHELFLTC